MPLELLSVRRSLLAWYRRHRRPLPWRATRDPYRIWVSEVMLQQTQVATARPYYRAFLRRFPTLRSLARAREEQVLAVWSGLGYYRRARHLRAAARRVMVEHGGRLPRDPRAFRSLPGVGRYTAGAVLSIAFDRPLPALDGNVARVLARLFGVRASVRNPHGAKRLWALAGSLVPMRRPGEWNQALMELGALVCAPRAPHCPSCPVRDACRAHRLGAPEAFPPALPRARLEHVRRAVAWIERGGRVLMVRRAGPQLAGLWEPPGVELGRGDDAGRALEDTLRGLGVRARLRPTGWIVRHTIARRRHLVEMWRGEPRRATGRARGLRYVRAAPSGVALTAVTRKMAELCRAVTALSSSSR
jgi:A/G-specific adenine glycosylase